MHTGFEAILSVRVPKRIVERTHQHLVACGEDMCEGLALWAGSAAKQSFNVTAVVLPVQHAVTSQDGSVGIVVDGDELLRINMWLHREGLTLIAQVHSHPREAYHSATDNRLAMVTRVGCLSIVVPYFGKFGFEFDRIACYKLGRKGGWHVMTGTEVKRLIVITPG